MILTIDNKIHHLKELDFIERQLHNRMNPEQFYKAIGKFLFDSKDINLKTKTYLTFEETVKVDDFVKKYFVDLLPEAETLFLRAYIVGRLLAESDKTATVFKIDEFSRLPKVVQQAVKEYGLTIAEGKAIEKMISEGVTQLSNTMTATQQTVKSAIIEAIKQREGVAGIDKRIRENIVDDSAELNRRWMDVVVYETNKAFTDGYLSRMADGEYVLGVSMPDACPHCIEDIDGKVYKVTKNPPPAYENMREGKEKELIKQRWENEIWEDKSNIGRSTSPNKRIDPKRGNSKDNLTRRGHHEMSMPTIPLHSKCRCRWVTLLPEFQWIDLEGNVRLKAENPEEHRKWYEKTILGFDNE